MGLKKNYGIRRSKFAGFSGIAHFRPRGGQTNSRSESGLPGQGLLKAKGQQQTGTENVKWDCFQETNSLKPPQKGWTPLDM
jgi:hypothetical protein